MSESLKSVLMHYNFPTDLVSGVSDRWQCRFVPHCGNDSDRMMDCASKGIPFTVRSFFSQTLFNSNTRTTPTQVDDSHAKEAFDVVKEDALEYLMSSDDTFDPPKLAMVGGWGTPGSSVYGEEHLALVKSVTELLKDKRPLNLQMFHRKKGKLPPLPALLKWPMSDVLHKDTPRPRDAKSKASTRALAGDHDDDDDEEVDREYRLKEMKGRSVNVDMATRISRKGALTWWHLDDGGEFTFQTGLPVRSV